MKVKIWNRRIQDIISRTRLLPTKLHLLVLGPIHTLGIQLLQKRNRLRNPLLQLLKRGLVIGPRFGGCFADAHSDAFAGVGYTLDLVGERLHVGDETGLEEGGFLVGGVGEGFGEEGREDFEIADEAGDGDVVEGERHCERFLGGGCMRLGVIIGLGFGWEK